MHGGRNWSPWLSDAAQGSDARQDAVAPAGKLAVHDLALDLQADQQEEHRHLRVVDPVQDAERADIAGKRAKIGRHQGEFATSRARAEAAMSTRPPEAE